MKRITIALALVLTLVLAACSPQNQEAAALAGDWAGDLQIAGATVPVAFTVDARGEIDDSTFHLAVEGENFSYRVDSSVFNSRILIDASASADGVGEATFNLDGQIGDEEISGTYELEGYLLTGDGRVTLEQSGTFSISRVHAAE